MPRSCQIDLRQSAYNCCRTNILVQCYPIRPGFNKCRSRFRRPTRKPFEWTMTHRSWSGQAESSSVLAHNRFDEGQQRTQMALSLKTSIGSTSRSNQAPNKHSLKASSSAPWKAETLSFRSLLVIQTKCMPLRSACSRSSLLGRRYTRISQRVLILFPTPPYDSRSRITCLVRKLYI